MAFATHGRNDVCAVRVDERDASWEGPDPRFRAYLHGSGETETAGRTDTYDITGGDVLQVIDWAQQQAGGKLTYAVALVVEDTTQPADERQGLVWLLGRDGNDVDTDPDELTRHQRMLSRRAHPVGVPDFDAVPAAVFSPYTDGSERRWL